MVQLRQYLKSTSSDSKPLPLLNSLFQQQFSALSPYGPEQSYKTFVKWARRCPHLIGFLNVIVTDIISDEITFKPLNRGSGRNRVQQAQKFWDLNHGEEVLEETLNDVFLLGIGYNWKGTIEKQLKEFSGRLANKLEVKAIDIENSILTDEEVVIARKLRHIPASTVTIEADKYEPKAYIQRVGVSTKRYLPEEVISFKLMPLDGKLYPYPPMEALLSEVYLLWLISQNYVSYFENGGHPDKVFVLPKDLAGSKNHSYLIETLKKYRKIQNKHGNLVFTGELTIEDMTKVENQMEHKELSLYLVGVLAMFYGIPAGRIPFLIGKAANNGDSGGLADSGYWRKISVWQSKVEKSYNRELFEPYFGVQMCFARGYKQDEVRETNIEKQKTDIVQQRMNLGLMTPEAAGEYLDIDPEVIAEAQKLKEEQEQMERDLFMQNQQSKDNVMMEPDKKLKNKTKQNTQLNNQTNKGGKTINP